jgi:hypothetical protein
MGQGGESQAQPGLSVWPWHISEDQGLVERPSAETLPPAQWSHKCQEQHSSQRKGSGCCSSNWPF